MVKEYVTGTVGRELGSVPFGTMIKNIAVGIAEGQLALDKSSMEVAEFMSGQKVLFNYDERRATKSVDPAIARDYSDQEPYIHDSRIYFGYDLEFKGDVATAKLEITEGTREDEAGNTIKDEDGDDIIFKGIIKLTQDDNMKGAEYDFAPKVEIVGDGVGATAIATRNDDGTVEIAIGDPGQGYTEAELIVSGGKIPKRIPRKVSMLELGFAPNFYQFVETVIEIKITVNMVEEQTEEKGETPRTDVSYSTTSETKYSARANYNWWRGYSYSGTYSNKRTSQLAMTKSVDPAMSAKYNYSIEGSSSVRTRLVPIPPPTILEERVRALIDLDKEYQDIMRAMSGK